jgi:hypothetical protein
MSKSIKSKEDRKISFDKTKNKKLVKILNHKMFKGYRDIKASKNFYKRNINLNKQTLGCLEWEKKVYDYFEDLYNLDYKLNVLSKLKNPSFNNIMYIKHFPNTTQNAPKTTISNIDSKIKKTKSSLNTISTSNPNLTTMNSMNKKSKIQSNSNNNFYLTSMSVYHTDNFYHKYNPEKVIKEIFDKENIYYNDIPLLSLEKINKYNNPKRKKKYKYITSDDEIIKSNNIKDNIYNGLTERQFLYKISHNKSNKNIKEKIQLNSFIKNKGISKLSDIQRLKLKSASRGKKDKPNLLSLLDNGDKNVNINLELNDNGLVLMNKMVSTSINNFNQETLFDKHNQYLIYKGGFNSDNSISSYNKSKSIISTLYENQKNKDDKIFGDPFKNIDINNNKKKEEPPVKFFQNKPRIFDDKLLLNYQFVKKNQFLKLKEIMS